jgi:uncharacterized damage-inducible protein DinB
MPTPPVPDLEDPRREEPAYIADERVMLERWLDFHRVTLLLKCEGLSVEELKQRPIATSKLSLHGLVRHMADVERGWFRRTFLSVPEMVFRYDGGSDNPDAEFEPLDDTDWESDLAAWLEECDASRATVSGRLLDEVGSRRGTAVSLRWIYVHMIEEYARHNGHADLIRELIDGSTGW